MTRLDGKNPTPQEELHFWSELTSNLQCIYDQLVSPKVKKMAKALMEKDSSYSQSLVNMFEDVKVHLEEARDISMVSIQYTSSTVTILFSICGHYDHCWMTSNRQI